MSQLTIHRHPATIHYFTEDLGSKVTIDLVLIPAGSFEMGSPENELERRDNESPQHTVTVPTFFMGRSPITQAQWRQVAKLPKVRDDLEPNPSVFKGDDRPVESVSWNDATEFCTRLSRSTNRDYRLPSEAEWEYACRASPVFIADTSRVGDAVGEGISSPFHFGETISTDLANYNGTDERYGAYGRGAKGISRQTKTDVGSFPPNQFGLHNMHGNVWEWCQDTWHDSYKNAPTDGSAWEDEKFSFRIIRGGSWSDDPGYCRSASRGFSSPGIHINFGFRVVCAAPRTLV
jgi:formylglycine-generating enzyme required for sulfatase activity